MSVKDKILKDFDSVSKRYSENIAVYYASDLNHCLGISYFELNRVSNELRLYFSKLFGEKSQYIGVSLSDYFLLPCLLLGIWKSANCFAGVGNQYTEKDNLEFLDFLRIKYLITDTDKNEYGGKLISGFFVHERQFFVWCRSVEEEMAHVEEICFGIMTSGSTGEPKIIQVPWTCILPNASELSAEFQVTELDCIFQGSPYSFDPFFIELFISFLNGSTLMIVSNALKLNPSHLLKALFDCERHNYLDSLPVSCSPTENKNYFHIKIQKVNKKNASILQITPSVFKRWTDSEIQNLILSSNSQLRILILGGEKFPKEILKLKCQGNTTKIFNIYGITEISCWAFLNEVTSTMSDTEISIGKPLNTIKYKISDNGELEIGSHVRICTVNREQNFHVEKPVFRKTGDIVKVCNGELYFIGRTNQTVKKFGLKINLIKIEDSFLRANKLIKQCFCIFDEENLKLALFYLPTIRTNEIKYKLITVDEFQKNNYKIPLDKIKSIEKPDYLVEISQPPLNSHGKRDNQEMLKFLKDVYKTEEHNPDIKIVFKKIWDEVLGIRNTNMFSLGFVELGGDSVLALEIVNKLEDGSFKIPQDFVVKLLSGESYNNCLECLCLAQEKSEIPRKRIRVNADIADVKLSPVWKFDLGKCVDATPVIFVYKGEERLVIGSHSYKLTCIKPDSGCEIWTTFLGDRIESGFRPTNDGSTGFIGCYDHFVYCIETSGGSVLWKFKTGDMVKSTPCLSSNEQIVYVASYDKHLYCLSTTEGKIKKSLKLSNGGVFCSGIVSDSLNSFFIGTLDGTCLAIDQETNERKWCTTLESPVFATPCLIPKKPEILFSEVLGKVHCLNSLNGNKMWTFKADGNIYSSPTINDPDEVLHIIFGCHDAHLYCLQYEAQPELKWKQKLDSPVFAKPFVVSDFLSVCATTTKGFVYLCEFVLGTVKARLKLEGEVFSSAVYHNKRLFVGCRDNNVYSLEISNVADD